VAVWAVTGWAVVGWAVAGWAVVGWAVVGWAEAVWAVVGWAVAVWAVAVWAVVGWEVAEGAVGGGGAVAGGPVAVWAVVGWVVVSLVLERPGRAVVSVVGEGPGWVVAGWEEVGWAMGSAGERLGEKHGFCRLQATGVTAERDTSNSPLGRVPDWLVRGNDASPSLVAARSMWGWMWLEDGRRGGGAESSVPLPPRKRRVAEPVRCESGVKNSEEGEDGGVDEGAAALVGLAPAVSAAGAAAWGGLKPAAPAARAAVCGGGNTGGLSCRGGSVWGATPAVPAAGAAVCI
jgi:hypothetical protein